MWTVNQLNGFFVIDNVAQWRVNYVTYIHQYKYTYCLCENARFENLIWKKQKQPLRGVLGKRYPETFKSSNNTYEEVQIYRFMKWNFIFYIDIFQEIWVQISRGKL